MPNKRICFLVQLHLSYIWWRKKIKQVNHTMEFPFLLLVWTFWQNYSCVQACSSSNIESTSAGVYGENPVLLTNQNAAYQCKGAVCTWENGAFNQDWGYFSNKTGRCRNWIELCEKEDFCQAVECGKEYCSWWRNDACKHPTTPDSTLRTCIKNRFVKSNLSYK